MGRSGRAPAAGVSPSNVRWVDEVDRGRRVPRGSSRATPSPPAASRASPSPLRPNLRQRGGGASARAAPSVMRRPSGAVLRPNASSGQSSPRNSQSRSPQRAQGASLTPRGGAVTRTVSIGQSSDRGLPSGDEDGATTEDDGGLQPRQRQQRRNRPRRRPRGRGRGQSQGRSDRSENSLNR